MAKLTDMLPSRFLKKEDVPAPVLVTIAKVDEEIIDKDSGELKWCMHFQEMPKPLALNSTNLQIAFAVTGVEDSDDMAGHQIVLYNDPMVQYQGKLTGGLRLRAPKRPATPAPVKRPQQQPLPPIESGMADLDDDVPF